MKNKHNLSSLLAAIFAAPCRPRTLQVLDAVRHRPLSMSKVASYCGVSTAAMTGLVDVAERDGLVRREEQGDRRTRLICIMPAGSDLLKQADFNLGVDA